MRRLALCALLVAGCSGIPSPLSWRAPRIGERPSTDHPEAERAYYEVLERYSDRGEVYARLDTRMFLGATLQTPTFREARVKFVATLEKLPSAEVEKRLATEQTEAAAAHVFFVGAHLNDYRFDDFDKSTSIWRVALITGGQEVLPTKVERVGRSNLSRRTLYPYLDEFWTAYRFTFPKQRADGAETISAGTEKVVLRFASTVGTEELEFPAR